MAAVDRFDDFEPSETLWGCSLCDWENAPLRVDGSPDPGAPSAEERNGGFTLERARANFLAHAWMYDPEQREPWMTAAPSSRELGLRRALREAYESLRTTAERDQYELWGRITEYEHELRNLRIRRAQAAEDELDSPAA